MFQVRYVRSAASVRANSTTLRNCRSAPPGRPEPLVSGWTQERIFSASCRPARARRDTVRRTCPALAGRWPPRLLAAAGGRPDSSGHVHS